MLSRPLDVTVASSTPSIASRKSPAPTSTPGSVSGERIEKYADVPFYKHQKRVAMRNIGRIDPTEITDTIAAGGYRALARALTTMTPEELVAEIEASGLRGRGGAGRGGAHGE